MNPLTVPFFTNLSDAIHHAQKCGHAVLVAVGDSDGDSLWLVCPSGDVYPQPEMS